MKVSRLKIEIFLCYIVFIGSLTFSNIYGSPIDSSISDQTGKSLNSSDEDSSDFHIVDCSDLNSTLGRALKWVFKATSKHEKAPNVKFYVSSRIQPTRVEVRVGDEFRLEPTDFKVERKTVFIVHGFKSGGFKNWVKLMEDALLLWEDVNVVVVDWSLGKKSLNYYDAAKGTQIVGNEIARFLQHVINATTIATSPETPRWGTVHLIGHSLGAHISGVAARIYRDLGSDLRITRITGLDPAKLCFTGVSSDFRLDRTDAPFVDVIHTSAQTKSKIGLGMFEPIGHVDFYPNGGKIQPGCSQRSGSVLSYLNVPKSYIEQAKCSHKRSEYYLIESLVSAATGNCTFWAHPWDTSDHDVAKVMSESCNSHNCTEMGIRAEKYSLRGTFYLMTASKPPFCVPYEYVREK